MATELTGHGQQVIVLDEVGVPTGESLPFDEAVARGAWHGKLIVWVVREGGEVLLSRLPRDHAFEPSKLAPTAVADPGMGPPGQAVIDAVRTWLGGAGRLGEPRYLGTFRSERHYRVQTGEASLRQHQDAYVLTLDAPLEELSPNPRLVDTVYGLPLTQAVAWLEAGGHVPAPGFDSMGRVSNALLVEEDLPSQGRSELREQLEAVAALTMGTASGSNAE